MCQWKKKEKEEVVEEDGYMDPDVKNLIDFGWILYVLLTVGLSKCEIGQMKYFECMEMINNWKKHHNIMVEQRKWKL